MSLTRLACCLVLPVGLSACAGEPTNDLGHSDHDSAATSREGLTPLIGEWVAAGRFQGERWRVNLSERVGETVALESITVDGNRLLAQDQTSQIHAIDGDTGAHRWIVQLPGPMTQTIGGTPSTVAFVSVDDFVAVDRTTGSRLTGPAAVRRPYAHLGFFPSGRAVAVGGTLFIGRLAPFGLQSIDLAGGLEGWAYATTSPVVDVVVYGDGPTGQVIGVTEDGLLFSLPPRDAVQSAWAPAENWYRRLAGTRVVTPLSLSGDSLVFGSADGFLYHVDARTGAIRWKLGCGDDLRGHDATIAGGSIYQRTDDRVAALDAASGAELWSAPGAKRAITRIGDRVYLELGDDVVVVAAKSGKELARFAARGLTLPTVQGGGAFFASDGTNVFALE